MNLRTVLLLTLLLQSYWLMAQRPYLRPINYPNQLNTRTIYDLHASRDGQIWLGTDQGLWRFNGLHSYPIPFDYTRQNDISHLCEDQQQRLWAMNFANQIFYLENDTLRLFRSLPEALLRGNIIKIVLVEEQLWVCTTQSLLTVDIRHNLVSVKFQDLDIFIEDFTVFKGKPFLNIGGFTLSLDNGHWQKYRLGTSKGFRFIDTKEELILAQRELNGQIAYVFRQKHWWRLPKIEIEAGVTTYHYTRTDSQTLWICSKQGGWLWDFRTGKAECLFLDMEVSDIVRDYQGGYWISSLDRGLWYCPSLNTKVFEPWLSLQHRNEEITSISNFPQDPSQIWLTSTRGRFCKSDMQHNHTICFDTKYSKEIHLFGQSPQGTAIYSSTGIFDTLGQSTSLPPSKYIAHLRGQHFLSGQSYVAEWISPFAKLANAPATFMGKKIDRIKSQTWGYPIYNIRNQRCYSVCIDAEARKYWVGYADDLYEYDFEGKYRIIKDQKGESILAKTLCLNPSGGLLVATPTRGFMLIVQQEVKAHLDRYNGLRSNFGRHIKIFRDTVWLCTNQEIGYWLPQQGIFKEESGTSGIGQINYQDFTFQGDKLYIANETQIISIYQHDPPAKSLYLCPPRVSIEGNNCLVWLEALAYQNPQQVKLYYRFKQSGAQWQTADKISLELRYQSLSPRQYTLEFYAIDKLSGLQSIIQEVHFKIPKAWWQTWAALFAFTLLGLLGLILIIKLLIWRVRRQQRLREDLWISQLKAIKTQMNPHFLYNLLNSVQGLVYSNQKSEAAALLGDFSDFTRRVLESSENPYISIREEIQNLSLYLKLEAQRFEPEEFQYEINYQNIVHLLEERIPSMLLQPFVENAIKHGLLHKKGLKDLSIDFSLPSPKTLSICIKDNGIGREHAAQIRQRKAQKSTQFSTQAIWQRIALINNMKVFEISLNIEDLYCKNGEASGTEVQLTIRNRYNAF